MIAEEQKQILSYVITRADNGWIGRIETGGNTEQVTVAHDEGQWSNPVSASLSEVLWDLFSDRLQSKYAPGIVVEYVDKGSDAK